MKLLCNINEIPDQTVKGFPLDDREVIVCNWNGKLHLYLNDCPHAGWPLNFEPDKFLDMEQRYLQCSTHMALFEIEDGNCISGPCEGCALTAVPFQVENGKVMAELPAEENPET